MDNPQLRKRIDLCNSFCGIREITRSVLLTLVMLIGFGLANTYGQGEVNIYGDPSPANVAVGDDFEITLQIDPDGNLVTAVHVVMNFNPALIRVNSLSLVPGNPLNNELGDTEIDNTTGYLSIASFGFAPASDFFDYATISCTALAGGTSNLSFVRTGDPKTLFGYAAFDVTGTTDPITINISTTDCPALGVNNGDPCSVAGQPGQYVDCECLVYDCFNIPGGGAVVDDCGSCVGGTTGEIACLSGSVVRNSNCGTRDATATFYLPGTATEVASFEISIQDDGSFNIPVFETGTFDVIIKVDGYLAKGTRNVVINEVDNNLEVGVIKFGDITGDNIVNFLDAGALSQTYFTAVGQPFYNPLADFNCDGAVNFLDAGALSQSYFTAGDTAPLVDQ